MAWITPKMDWVISDSMNAVDFNRIENNILELYNYLLSIQYVTPTPSSTNTTRTTISIDFLSSINRIENNLDNIRVAFMTPAAYLSKKTWTVGIGFDYTDANRLESNTNLLREIAFLVPKSYRYCGAYTCGDTGALY